MIQMIRKFVIPSLASVLLAILMISCSADGESRLPNIVLINADDLGYGDLACFFCILISMQQIFMWLWMGVIQIPAILKHHFVRLETPQR